MNADPAYIYPSSKTKNSVLLYLNSSVLSIEAMKDELIQDFNAKLKSLTSKFSAEYNEISRIRLKYIELIKKIIETSQIIANSTSLADKILCLSTDPALESLLQIPFITQGIELGLSRPESSQNQIAAFQHNTKNLLKINLSNFKETKIELNTKSKANEHIIMCELPDNQIFCYGNWEPVGTTFIIDAENNIIELDDGKPCCSTYATLFEDSIYVFGGWKTKGERSNFAVKFSLQTAEWKDLAPLPISSTAVCSLAADNEIWLSGYNHQKLYSYSIEKNNYQEYIDLALNCNKIICRGDSLSIYVIESGGKIIKSEFDGYNWQLVGNILQFNDVISYYKLYMGSVYFLDYDYVLYAFNLGEKHLDMIKQFN
ncbi:unnamed protein product [Blepharisma stoltei]|uniref:Kelch motif family protein n=1 Tax=Blepharisma stoltei TaxID=1481888 RepID=A0AAU9J8V0_9CILI|nr:unnamed protein product [Blepharisma stoltei]